jgi:hypothetical protein
MIHSKQLLSVIREISGWIFYPQRGKITCDELH